MAAFFDYFQQGGNGADTLVGTSQNDSISGGAGDDTIRAMAAKTLSSVMRATTPSELTPRITAT